MRPEKGINTILTRNYAVVILVSLLLVASTLIMPQGNLPAFAQQADNGEPEQDGLEALTNLRALVDTAPPQRGSGGLLGDIIDARDLDGLADAVGASDSSELTQNPSVTDSEGLEDLVEVTDTDGLLGLVDVPDLRQLLDTLGPRPNPSDEETPPPSDEGGDGEEEEEETPTPRSRGGGGDGEEEEEETPTPRSRGGGGDGEEEEEETPTPRSRGGGGDGEEEEEETPTPRSRGGGGDGGDTPSRGGGEDRFGIEQIYETASGGPTWYIKQQEDPTSDGHFYYGMYRGTTIDYSGNGVWRVNARSGTEEHGIRMHVDSPSGKWKNTEMTGYFRVIQGNDQITMIARHGPSYHDEEGCLAYGYYGMTAVDGNVYFKKKLWHYDDGYTRRLAQIDALDNLLNDWIGMKFVVYDLENGDVKLELWIDEGDMTNNWRKVTELVDDGDVHVEGEDCGTPSNRIIKEGTRASFRVDDSLFDFKKLSVREIG
jgi:hypothetical protein